MAGQWLRWTTVGTGCALCGAALALGSVGAAGQELPPGQVCGTVDYIDRGDLDGDESSDVVVGMPGQNDAGAVDVRYSRAPSRLIRAGELGGDAGEGAQFGSALAVGDLDRDGCADLVVGAPNEGQGPGSDGEGGYEGQVHVVFGGLGGLDLGTAMLLPHDSEPFDRFGAGVAMAPRTVAGVVVHDLFVGAPNATVSGVAQAGEVFRYTITPDPGSPARVQAVLAEVRDQDSPGVPGAAEARDHFGAVLAAADWDGVVVGAPDEDIGSVRDAGAVWFLRTGPDGAPVTSQSWSQDSAGVAGVPERGDRLGAAVGSRGYWMAAGVPGEDDGKRADSGMVQFFSDRREGELMTFAPAFGATQDTAGFPGVIEAGDRFGAAVVVGDSVGCGEATGAAIGAPGEDLGTRGDAGTVTLAGLSWRTRSCAPRVIRQGAGLAGAAEAGDEVGSVLALTRGRTDLENDYQDRLLIGVPSEDIGAVTDAGMVQPSQGGVDVANSYVSTVQFSLGYLLSRGYGEVLSSASD